MNCLECQDILQQKLDGVPIAADARLDAHLAQCAVCRERHAAARRLLEGLRTAPPVQAPKDLTSRVLTRVLRDRERRRARMRRSLLVTAALAASILIMLLFAYFRAPHGGEGKGPPEPIARDNPPRRDDPRPHGPPIVKEKDVPPKDDHKHDPANNLASLTGRLADKTLDQAKALWTAANPVEQLPPVELPNVKELDPAAEPIRHATKEMGDGLGAVTQSARRAFDYFARELPLFDMPPSAEQK